MRQRLKIAQALTKPAARKAVPQGRRHG